MTSDYNTKPRAYKSRLPRPESQPVQSRQPNRFDFVVELYRSIRGILKQRTVDPKVTKRAMAFRGKNAVVTGGAGGIGLQVARQLLVAGAGVSYD